MIESSSSDTDEQPELLARDSTAKSARPSHHMSARNRWLFFITAWLIVLMPFLFWWNTWFGRQLSDKLITEYLKDEKHPEMVRLAAHPVEEVRNTDAWVMGQDTSGTGFHETLLKMLEDSSGMVRGNAALSLVRFGDAAGRPQIVALLRPARIVAPASGRVMDTDKPGTAIHQGGLIAKIQTGQKTTELRSPISGRIRTLSAVTGTSVAAGSEVATVDPSDDQVWEALRALYLIGLADDLPAIRPYQRELPGISDRVRQQALLTENAIRERAAAHP